MAFGKGAGSDARRGTPADLLVVGLGNPGAEYAGTRHNVGADTVAVLADRHGGRLRAGKERALVTEVRIGDRRMAVAFPQTFYNESGMAVAALLRRHGIEELQRLVIVHDELDLPPGRLQVKLGGGLAGNKGLKSIRAHTHGDDFARVRLGVGKPPGRQHGTDHVLRRPGKAERVELDVMVQEAADAVETILLHGVERAMNRFNGNVVGLSPAGMSGKPQRSTGITGQSSGRGTWVTPKVCHTTTSVPVRDRSAAVQRGRPSSPGCWLG